MKPRVMRGSLLDDIFRDVSPGFYVTSLHGDPLPEPVQIKMDLKENDLAYTVHAELPGVSKDNIYVSLSGSVVMLRAEVRQHDVQTQDDKVLRNERYFGSLSRSFQLPLEIEPSQARARVDNGVLTLTLPKKLGGGVQRLKIE
ncbi:Hsp20/alpha crystallin family protein [Rhodoferax ferrireducens]|uniref:Hsp20/alpha crystallin family protein n=1 Tax=Rhodoferax ferrireducens TaxID=192843 RepID=UPI000E0E0196|nr:Hsp20 family protein [Rhodoferax ferrireducens]